MIGRSCLQSTLVCCVLIGWLCPAEAQVQGRLALAEARDRMVDREIVAAGVSDRRVIKAMRATPRHEFVPLAQRRYAYLDMALPIGESQTISPPFVVAYMTELLDPQPTDRVLEIGTGSGYQAAVLSGLVGDVYTIEIVAALGRRAARTLERLKYDNVHTRIGDGFQGWPEEAPFDKIIVTCSPERVPAPLAAQLKEGGRMVIPVGQRYNQTIHLLTKKNGKLVLVSQLPTFFVPMTGRAEEGRQVLPDPANPAINNGDFEQVTGQQPGPAGWHYQRQLELVTDGDAPSGKNYVSFRNSQPGRGCQALQGFAVDGRKVRRLEVSLMVRGRNIRPGQTVRQLPLLAITFYDENRSTLGRLAIGPWRGTFAWQPETRQIEVPPRAREAIVQIGLLGAVGEISFDAIELKPVRK
jgi:protein-L-isoaspartate(D-aspartate) O-methyltransferase